MPFLGLHSQKLLFSKIGVYVIIQDDYFKCGYFLHMTLQSPEWLILQRSSSG